MQVKQKTRKQIAKGKKRGSLAFFLGMIVLIFVAMLLVQDWLYQIWFWLVLGCLLFGSIGLYLTFRLDTAWGSVPRMSREMVFKIKEERTKGTQKQTTPRTGPPREKRTLPITKESKDESWPEREEPKRATSGTTETVPVVKSKRIEQEGPIEEMLSKSQLEKQPENTKKSTVAVQDSRSALEKSLQASRDKQRAESREKSNAELSTPFQPIEADKTPRKPAIKIAPSRTTDEDEIDEEQDDQEDELGDIDLSVFSRGKASWKVVYATLVAFKELGIRQFSKSKIRTTLGINKDKEIGKLFKHLNRAIYYDMIYKKGNKFIIVREEESSDA